MKEIHVVTVSDIFRAVMTLAVATGLLYGLWWFFTVGMLRLLGWLLTI